MLDGLLASLASISPASATMLVGAMPLLELRLAIPLAIGVFGLSPFEAFFWACLGNAFPVLLLYALLPAVLRRTPRFPRLQGLMDRYFRHLKDKNRQSIERWGSLALFFFVAIPFPGTGVWSGTLLAFLFRLPSRYALPAILLGMAAAGVLVALATIGVLNGLARFIP